MFSYTETAPRKLPKINQQMGADNRFKVPDGPIKPKRVDL